jgi:uncharacterized protein YndB with AHSA1/START domain
MPMKWLKRIVVSVAVLIGLLLVVGLLLPSEFKVQRAVKVAVPPAKVYPLVADPRQWKHWTVWNQRDPAMQMSYSGAESGAGAKWSWQSKTEGDGVMEFTRVVPNERVDYTLSFPDMGMTSRGELRLVPDGSGTLVTWTNEGDMGGNPVNRYFGVMMDRLVGPDFEAGLANLKALAEKS